MMTGRHLLEIVLTGLVVLHGLAQAANLQISSAERLNVFDKAWEKVNQTFFDPKFNGVNWAQMKEKYRPLAEAATDKVQLVGVLQSMLSELRTSHMGVKGDFPTLHYGTGSSYFQVEGKWLVSWVDPGSPAQLAGLERGWILTRSAGDCASPNGKVTAQFLDLREQAQSLELPCAPYSSATPEAPGSFRALEKGAVYLRLTSFTPGPAKWLADQVARNKSASAIVLDLRGNAGGSTESQLKVFDLFFSAKTVIGKFRERKGKEYTLKTGGNKSAYQGRILVLTDSATQSAAEVFAQAIQETGRGLVIGQRTTGGVLLGNHFKLPNGFDLHVAVMNYHSVKGIRLEGHGVIPDVPVDLTVKDYRENRDTVLDQANQLLQLP